MFPVVHVNQQSFSRRTTPILLITCPPMRVVLFYLDSGGNSEVKMDHLYSFSWESGLGYKELWEGSFVVVVVARSLEHIELWLHKGPEKSHQCKEEWMKMFTEKLRQSTGWPRGNGRLDGVGTVCGSCGLVVPIPIPLESQFFSLLFSLERESCVLPKTPTLWLS